VKLSVANRSISLLVPETEIARRLEEESLRKKAALPSEAQRGYLKLYLQNVTQADRGCDFDFLRAVDMKHTAP
jgi:dihydroxy-acid dehydratase